MTRASPDPSAGADIRVLLIDDHALVRRGLALLIAQQPGLCVCGEAGTMAEGLDAVRDLRPDVAVVDIALAGADGLALVQQIKARWPEVRSLVLSMHSEALFAERALHAGAGGYLMKERAPDTLATAIRRIADGGVYVSDDLKDRLIQRLAKSTEGADGSAVHVLSDRELAVYRLLGTGLTTRQVADQLHLSIKTIQSHVEHIKQKLDMKTSGVLVRHATLWMEHEKGG